MRDYKRQPRRIAGIASSPMPVDPRSAKVLANLLQLDFAGIPPLIVTACVQADVGSFDQSGCYERNGEHRQGVVSAFWACDRKPDCRFWKPDYRFFHGAVAPWLSSGTNVGGFWCYRSCST